MRLALLITLLSAPALAGELFVNGVSVEGLTNQTFEKVNVRIDDKGNVWIDAPGYAVKRVNAPVERDPGVVVRDVPSSLSLHYFVVTEQSPPGMTEYDIDLYINGKFIRSMHSGDEQLVMDINKYLKVGKNQVLLQAKKKPPRPEGAKSVSKSHVFRVIVGEGAMGADQVVIERPLITFTRTAADSNDLAQEFTLTAK